MVDAERLLSSRGELQAIEIATWFENKSVSSILSSPAARCEATVAPMAEAKKLRVTSLAKLGEGLNPQTLVKLLEQADIDRTVICSHGDMIPGALRLLEMRGLEFLDSRHQCAKGSIWTIDFASDFTGSATYSA